MRLTNHRLSNTWRATKEWLLDHALFFTFIFLLVAAGTVVFWKRVVIIIPAGHLGVIYSPFHGGVQLDTLVQEGLNIIPPWHTVTTYDTRILINTMVLKVLTKDQVNSEVKMSFQYQLNRDTLPLLHKYIGSSYLDKIVLPQLQGQTRLMFAKFISSEAFTSKLESITSDIVISTENVILDKLGPPGLTNIRLLLIASLQVESVIYPPEIDAAIKNKIVESQNVETAGYKNQATKIEADRKVIEAGGIKSFQDIVNAGMTDNYLKLRGIEATERLAASQNSKIVIFGSSSSGLPLILGNDATEAFKK